MLFIKYKFICITKKHNLISRKEHSMKTRIIAFALLIAMALTLLVSCGGSDITTSPQQTEPGAATTNKEIVEDAVELVGDGEVIKIMSGNREWFYDELSLEAHEIANVIDQSVYDREAYVESRLNIDIAVEKTNPDIIDQKIPILYDSNDDTYDMIAHQRCNIYTRLNCFYNLYEVENVDLSMPWYNQSWIECSPDGVVPWICGDATLSILRFTFVTMCNLPLLNQYGIDNIYADVTNMTWTLDRQHEIVNTIYEDTNHNGLYDVGDVFGFVTNTCTATDAYWSACDLDFINKNEDGDFYLAVDVDKCTTATDKINALFHNNNGTLILPHQSGDIEYDIAYEGFGSDLYAFATFRLIAVEEEPLIEMESPYGILPMPMLDEDQAGYGTYFHDMSYAIAILGCVKEERLPIIGATLEVFSQYSYNYTRSVYLDTALKGRYLRDQESREVLDLVVDSVSINAGLVYFSLNPGASLYLSFRTMVGANKSNWSSILRANHKIVQAQLDKFNSGEF